MAHGANLPRQIQNGPQVLFLEPVFTNRSCLDRPGCMFIACEPSWGHKDCIGVDCPLRDLFNCWVEGNVSFTDLDLDDAELGGNVPGRQALCATMQGCTVGAQARAPLKLSES